MKLNTKLLITYSVTGLLLLLTIGYFTQVDVREETFQSIYESFVDQLYQVDFALTSFLVDVEYDVLDLVANEVVNTGDDDGFTSFLEADESTFQYDYGAQELAIIEVFNTYRLNHPYANSVYMGRENGSFVRSHPRNRPTQYDPRERPWYQLGASNPDKVMRTSPYQSVTIADVNIGTVKALVDDAGAVYGVVGIDITLRNLTEYISNINVGEAGYIVLLDDNGILLTGYDEETRFKTYDEVGLDYFQEVMDNATGYTSFEEDSEGRYLFYYTSPTLGWKICAIVPVQEVNLQVSGFVYRVLGILTLSLSLLGLLSMIGVRRFIIRPIKVLEKSTQTIIRTGDLDYRIAIDSQDEIGQLAGSFNEMVDSITRAKNELQKGEEQYRSLVNNINVGIFRTTTDAQGRLLHANPAVARIMGYDSVDEMMGTSIVDLYQDAEERHRLIKQLEQHDRVKDYEVQLLRKDGTYICGSLSISVRRNEDGRAMWLEGVLEDVTARKQAEDALLRARDELELKVRERTAELRSRNEELDAYAHTVAHDLRNPLASVIGFAEILAAEYADSMTPTGWDCVDEILQTSRKMNNIIDSLLLLAELREMDTQLAPVDMDPVVAGALRQLAFMIEQQEAEIVQPERWPSAVGYSPWIEAVWANLISNAIKYGGRPPRVELGWDAPAGDQVRFWVRDNGPGVVVEEPEHLFAQFSRIEPQAAVQGHGVGLSIVKRIVERLGGAVGMESKLGHGSTFFFTLPAE